MPFITDPTWTPSRYRAALSAWQHSAESTDSAILPRKAAATASPRHSALSDKLKGLLKWRAAASPSDWTAVAANDNRPAGQPQLLDSHSEIRPSEAETMLAIKDVELEQRRHAKFGGSGELVLVPAGGDMERAKVWAGSKRRGREPECVSRLGAIKFSNGAKEEAALIRDAVGNIVRGSVRIPLGGVTFVGKYKPRDRFTSPKGADNDNEPQVTVGMSANSSAGRFDFSDPVEDAQEAVRVREAVRPEIARILDFALTAVNFREVGELLGHEGKTAERQGKAAVIAACEELDAALAA